MQRTEGDRTLLLTRLGAPGPADRRWIATLSRERLLVAGFLVVTAGLGGLAGSGAGTIALVGTVGLVIALALFLRPDWGPSFYVLTGLISSGALGQLSSSSATPTQDATATSRLYPGVLIWLLVVLACALHVVVRRDDRDATRPAGIRPWHPRGLYVALLAFIAEALLSMLLSRLYPDPNVRYTFRHSTVSFAVTQLAELSILLALPTAPVVVVYLVRSEAALRRLLLSFTALGVVMAVGTLVATVLGISSIDILGHERPIVLGLTSSALGQFLLLFGCIGLGMTLGQPWRSEVPRGWLAYTALLTLSILLAFGRSAWISFGIAIVVALILTLRRHPLVFVPIISGGVLLLATVVVPFAAQFFDPTKVGGLDRLIIFNDALTIWQHGPWLGVGAGNFQFFDIAYGREVAGVAHSQYFSVLAEMGIAGLLILVTIVVLMGRLTIQTVRLSPPGLLRAVAVGYCAYYFSQLFALFNGDWLFPTAAEGGGTFSVVVILYTWLYLGLMLATRQIAAAVAPEPVGNSQGSSHGRPSMS